MQLTGTISQNVFLVLISTSASILVDANPISADAANSLASGSGTNNLQPARDPDPNAIYYGIARWCTDDATEIAIFKSNNIKDPACLGYLTTLLDSGMQHDSQGCIATGPTQWSDIDNYGCAIGQGFKIGVDGCKHAFSSYMKGTNRDLANPGSKGSKCPGLVAYH